MEFRILGPIEVVSNATEVALGGIRQRAVLAQLLLRANEVVSRDKLVEGVWGERPPATAERTIDSYISRLRSALGPDRIERRAPGYRLRVEPDELDLTRFERLVAAGRDKLAASQPANAVESFDAALALWRGDPLADLTYEPVGRDHIEQLEEQRLCCREDRMEALLTQGQGAELIAELDALVSQHPFRERLVGQLMLALYRSGRQAEALGRYQVWRVRLSSELGLEPGPTLRELERKILAHDQSLERVDEERRARAPLHRHRLLIAAIAALVLAGVTVATVVVMRSSAQPSAAATSAALARLGSHAATTLPSAASAVAAGDGALWLAEPDAAAVVRVDQASARIIGRIPVGGSPGTIAFGAGAVWVASVPGDNVLRIDPTTNAVVRIPLGNARVTSLAFGLGKLWIADGTDDALLQLDPRDDQIKNTIQLDLNPTALAVGDGGVWIADYNAGTVTEVNPNGGPLAPIHVGSGPTQLLAAERSIWVVNNLDSTVSRIDPATDSVTATISVGSGPDGLASTQGTVWVGNEFSQTISRIDASAATVTSTSAALGEPTVVVAVGNRIWVGTQPLSGHRGGTVVLLHTPRISIDPAVNLDLGPLQSDGLVRDGLVTYNHVGGPDGTRLVPDLALAIPTATDGGRTYRFRLRRGIRYSNGRLVAAADFRRAVERLFRVGSSGSSLFSDIVGAHACNRARCDLRMGVITDGRTATVTFRLTVPDADFLSKLTTGGLVTPVPPGTPWHDVGNTPIPGTGPYRIASATAHEIRYVRNPMFREWSHAAQPTPIPDVILLRFGLSPTQEVRAIEQGRGDWMQDAIPAALLPEVEAHYGAQLHSNVGEETDFLQLNTRVPPFNDLRVRQALNYAVDRRYIARLHGGAIFATPTCQILPPGMTGYQPRCPYTRGPQDGRWNAPDIAKANALVSASGTRRQTIIVWGPSDDPLVAGAIVPYIVRVLKQLGYRAKAHLIPSNSFGSLAPHTFNTIQLTPPGWADATPAGFLATWFVCDSPLDHHWFCDASFDRLVHRAQTLETTDPRAAARVWARLDHIIVQIAATVPLVNDRAIDFVSRRIQNYEYNPALGAVADQFRAP